MKKNPDDKRKPLEINPTTLIQLDPDKLDSVVGGVGQDEVERLDSTKTGDTCDGCTHVGPDCRS